LKEKLYEKKDEISFGKKTVFEINNLQFLKNINMSRYGISVNFISDYNFEAVQLDTKILV